MESEGTDIQQCLEQVEEEGVFLLYSEWSSLLIGSRNMMIGSQSNVTVAPHLEDCKMKMQLTRHHDNRGQNGGFPPWRTWKVPLPTPESDQEQSSDGDEGDSKEPNPPWISGSNEDNIPLTRRVQHDIWEHQHPSNCRDPQLRFIVADWENLPGFGIGAQIAEMCGRLRIAIKEHNAY